MNSDPVLVGVDLGASHVRVGLFTRDGQSLDFQSMPLEEQRKADTGARCTIALVEKVLKANGSPQILGIGAGATGPVDPNLGTILSPYTDPAWQYVPYTELVSHHFQVPCVLENDADAAALGEFWQGTGQGTKRLLAVTVGTGIGTALIVDGQIYRGMGGFHPEGGHHIIDPSGPECYCGAHGCWESLACGTALDEYARTEARSHPEWLAQLGVAAISEINGAVVAQAARRDDPLAIQIMDREAYYLALGLVNMIIVYVPELIVLSGGVMKSYDLLETIVRSTIDRHNLMVPARQVQVVPARLGYYAGATGAAYALLLSLQNSHSS